MIEQEALDFTKTFETYDDFRSQEKSVLLSKYSALIGTSVDTDFESIYKDTYDFVMQTIYNYYDGYYLTSATKDRFLTLLGTIVSGKLPAYKVRYDNYLNARNLVYDNLSSRESTSVTSGTESGSGKQNYKNTKSGTRSESGTSKYADTPENINSATDFIDQYTTGQSKDSSSSSTSDESNTNTDYSNSRNKSGNKKYTDTLKGGAKQVWENVEAIPSEIYKEVITITAKLFFSESLEERVYPMTYITLTNKVKELEKKVVTGLEQELLDNYDLVTTITTDYQNFVATTSLKVFYDIATEYYEENKGRIDVLTGRMDTADSNIESLKARTTKNEQDIATNKTNIAKNTADIATNKTNIAKNTTDIATNKTNIAKNATDISALQTRMNTAETDINSLETRVGKTETDISNINADITTIETTLNASVKEVSHQYDTSTRALKINYTLNNGSVKTSTLYLPLATLTSAGLMSADQYSKLDQVVLYGTNYITTGRNFAVKKDEDNDLYVNVPLTIASTTTLGVIKVGKNLYITSDGTLNASDVEGFTAGDGLETTSGVTKVKTDSLTTGFNANKQVEVLTDGESIQAGSNGLEVKVDNSTIKIGDNGLEAVSSGGGGGKIFPDWDNVLYNGKSTSSIQSSGVTFNEDSCVSISSIIFDSPVSINGVSLMSRTAISGGYYYTQIGMVYMKANETLKVNSSLYLMVLGLKS